MTFVLTPSRYWNRRFAGVLVTVGLFGLVMLARFGVFGSEYWTREQPLDHPFEVASVNAGVIQLVDGRSFRPAGVRLRRGVSQKQMDDALRVMTAQGVLVDRDLRDGRAFLTVEPKFYNWCGTRGSNGLWWSRWAGGYFQCPLSPLLVHAEYAEPVDDEAGLSSKERRRLQAADHLRSYDSGPMRISPVHRALRYDGAFRSLNDLDEIIEYENQAPTN